MAEIKIEKKKPIWPWVLGLLVVLGIILFLFYATNRNDNHIDDSITNQPVMTDTISDKRNSTFGDTEANDSLANYKSSASYLVSLQESLKDPMKLGTDSTFTAKAFYNLANASVSKAMETDLYNSSALKSLELKLGQSKSTQLDEKDIDKLDLKTMTSEITTVISEIQMKSAPDLNQEVSNLKTVSNTLKSSTDWSKQQKNIQDYLSKANDILTNINY